VAVPCDLGDWRCGMNDYDEPFRITPGCLWFAVLVIAVAIVLILSGALES